MKADRGICYYPTDIIKSLNDYILANLELFPTTNKECKKASDVFVNDILQINEIAGQYLPILNYNGIISRKWRQKLKFKESLALDDYLEVLTKISHETDEEEKKENKKRIGLIYEKLAEQLPNLPLPKKENLSDWANNNKILAKNGDFYYPNELSYVTIDGFNASNLIFINKPTSKINELFKLWRVKIIDKVIPKISNSKVEIEDLRKQLKHISPLVALVALKELKNRKEWESKYKKINQKLSEISFYETTEIYISYGNEEDEQQQSTYADGNKFYYIGNWYKPRVLDGLVEPLCKFLDIRDADRILTVLLSDTFLEGLKYLKEKGFETSLIPEHLINPKEEEKVPNQWNRNYNQTDEDLGKKGEMIVFEELKRIYSNKYGQSIKETEDGFTIGRKLNVIWHNKSRNTIKDHDFKIIENNKEIYIDSKATPFGKNVEKVSLYISGNELNLMENAEKYLIARVYNVNENYSIEFVKLEIDKFAN